MTKIDLGQTIGIIANLGVIAGIVFLAVEIRQASNAVRSSTLQGIASQSYDISMRVAENADLREAQRTADRGGTLTEDQRDQLFASYTALMRLQQNRFQQMRLGILDEDTIFEVGGTGPGYRSPFFREYWAERSDRFSPEFREFMEVRVLPLGEGQ